MEIDSRVVQPEKQNLTADKKSPFISLISTLLFIISLFYFAHYSGVNGAITGMCITGIFDHAFDCLHNYRPFPFIGLLPVVNTLVTFSLLYAAFKVRGGSKYGFSIAIFAICMVFLGAIFISTFISPDVNLTLIYRGTSNVFNIQNLVFNTGNLYLSFIYTLSFITLILLIFSFKSFHYENKRFNKMPSIIFIVVVSFLCFQGYSYLYTLLGYAKALNDYPGYSEAQSKAKFHVYKPINPPDKQLIVDDFTYTNYANYQDRSGPSIPSVTARYDFSPRDIAEGKVPSHQIWMVENFNPNFSTEYYKTGKNPIIGIMQPSDYIAPGYKKISIPYAKNKEAFISVTTDNPAHPLVSLQFLTTDNIAIYLEGEPATEEEVLRFANSLK